MPPAKRHWLPFAALSAMAAPLLAQGDTAVSSPTYTPGDAWVSEDVIEKGQTGFSKNQINIVVEGIDSATMTVGIKTEGAPTGFEDHRIGTDWSQRRLVDGVETITTRPLQFPLHIGQSWSIDFTDHTRRGNLLADHVKRSYKVVGWEDVTVPAGHFHALKIAISGVDDLTISVPSNAGSAVVASPAGSTSIAHTAPGGIVQVARVMNEQFYYVPEIRNFAKSVEEQYNVDDVRISRQTRQLIRFTPKA